MYGHQERRYRRGQVAGAAPGRQPCRARRPPAQPAQDLPRHRAPDHLRRPQQHHPHPARGDQSHPPRLADTLYAPFASLGLQRARIRAVTARVANLAPAATGRTQLTFGPQTEDRRTLEPVIDKAKHR
ncbi:hypothetical protein BX265_7443 [Streptomyces sp. TLI_235]|nr:hypothetical protein BX265_7443 [Streptomyces sp. TLI_235]